MSWEKRRRLSEDILDTIGHTPLVKLRKITGGMKMDILAKLEFFGPTGSLKDRVYRELISRAIRRGDLRPGMTILESSTGNAGISCAFVGGILGYPVTVVMPAGMSEERKKIIKAYGAKIIETPGGESDVDLCIKEVQELKASSPGRYWEPSQFTNPDNPAAHYETTGPEIWEQSDTKIDALVASQGTGGVLSGVGRFLREKDSKIKVFAVEPAEAPLLSRSLWGTHQIEGIGDGFLPGNLALDQLDGIITTTSEEAIEVARRLALEEGIFCGISSGCNVAACLKLVKYYPQVRTVVTIINDTGQKYFSTALCGEDEAIESPDREHQLDSSSREKLELYRRKWRIIS